MPGYLLCQSWKRFLVYNDCLGMLLPDLWRLLWLGGIRMVLRRSFLYFRPRQRWNTLSYFIRIVSRRPDFKESIMSGYLAQFYEGLKISDWWIKAIRRLHTGFRQSETLKSEAFLSVPHSCSANCYSIRACHHALSLLGAFTSHPRTNPSKITKFNNSVKQRSPLSYAISAPERQKSKLNSE